MIYGICIGGHTWTSISINLFFFLDFATLVTRFLFLGVGINPSTARASAIDRSALASNSFCWAVVRDGFLAAAFAIRLLTSASSVGLIG